MKQKIIMSSGDIKRTLARISHEIIERNQQIEGIILVGMRTRGVPLAERLASLIESFGGTRVPVGTLDTSLYRDDLASLPSHPMIKSTDIPQNISGKTIILVDDVLFTGRSVRAAMDALIDLGRPNAIQLAVLVDRGHRELPIRPDYIGKNIPSSKGEKIKVKLTEVDGLDEVNISSAEEVS